MNTQSTHNKKHFFIALSLLLIAAILSAGMSLPAYAADPEPQILPGPETVLPDYIGGPAQPHPSPNSGVPQNPFLAPNPFNTVHMDPWNSDVVDIRGPVGRHPVTFSSTLADARKNPASVMFECVSSAFTSHGRLILSCFGVDEASVALIDPETLEVYDSYELPATLPEDVGGNRQLSAMINGLSTSYWLFDKDERFALSIKDKNKNNKIIILVEGGSDASPTLELAKEYDMSKWVPANNRISGVAMDWQGRIWFYLSGSSATSTSPGIPGAVYVLDLEKYPADDAVQSYTSFDQDEQIRNSLAITRTGVYVVTSKKMYRLGFDAKGDLQPVWEAGYDNAGYIKPGQYNAGSGTTPTILGEGKYVAITDNADPYMKVVVYRTEEQLDPNEKRIVCEMPVFMYAEGGALDNSLIGSGLSLIAENNYGYEFNFNNMTTTDSEPGFERIDIDPNGRGCTKVWVNDEVASTSSPKLSTRTGLIYTYARKYDDQNDVWVYYWTALDFRTGEVVWQKMAGTGHERFDTIWPTLYVGPNETLYVGLLGGFAAIRDTQGENIMARTTEQVFQAHLNAVQSGDIQQVMADYADDALMMTVNGAYVGKDAIQAFFTDQFNSQPITRASIDHLVVENDTMLVEWSAESEGANLPRAVDTYLIQGGKIARHTTWFRWVPK